MSWPRSSARRRAVTTISPAEAAIEDAASVAVEEAFGVPNRFSDAVCALEAVVTNAATVEDASSHALCPKFHLPFDIFSIFIPVLDRIIAGAKREIGRAHV